MKQNDPGPKDQKPIEKAPMPQLTEEQIIARDFTSLESYLDPDYNGEFREYISLGINKEGGVLETIEKKWFREGFHKIKNDQKLRMLQFLLGGIREAEHCTDELERHKKLEEIGKQLYTFYLKDYS